MRKVSLICHSVVALAMLFGIQAMAEITVSGGACLRFFDMASQNDISFQNFSFKNFSAQKNTLQLKEVLETLKKSNPKTDYQPYLASQVPQVLRMLSVKLYNSLIDIKRIEKKQFSTNPSIQKPGMELETKLKESYKLLATEAKQKIENKEITYEWYMDFFLKAIVLSDVTARVSDYNHTTYNRSTESYEILSKKIDIVLGKNNTIYWGDNRALKLYTSLGIQFSKMTKDRYFAKYSNTAPVVPVLFIPSHEDIVSAGKMGFYFVSLNETKSQTVEGTKYPLEFAGLQMDENLSQIHKTDSVTKNTSSKIHAVKTNDRVDDGKLEPLYKYMLKDILLHKEMMRKYQ